MSYISQRRIGQETSIPMLKEYKKSATSILEGYRFRMEIIIVAFIVGGGLGYVAYAALVTGAIDAFYSTRGNLRSRFLFFNYAFP